MCSIKTEILIDLIKFDLTKLTDWFYANHLSVNINETKCIIFGKPKKYDISKMNIILNMNKIEQQPCEPMKPADN